MRFGSKRTEKFEITRGALIVVTLDSVVALVGCWCCFHSKKNDIRAVKSWSHVVLNSKKMTFVGWWYAVKSLNYVVLNSMICNK